MTLLDPLQHKALSCPGRLASAGLLTAFLVCLVLLDAQGYRATPLPEVVVAITRHRVVDGRPAAATDASRAPAAAAQQPPAAMTQPAGGGAPRPYAYVVFTSSHKTGTVQLMCLSRVIRSLARVALDTTMGNSSSSDIAAAAAAAAAPPWRPGLMLSVLPLQQECFSTAPGSKHARCPQPEVPCDATGMPLLSLAGCVLHLPVASQGPTGVVHFVRNPWDVVVSAYFFHTQTPAPEAWLDKEFSVRVDLMRGGGVPLARLAALGLTQRHANMSYGDVLRSLPEDLGVQLEFWRSAPGLYAMARQYAVLRQHPAAQQHRFEDAQQQFNSTVLRIATEYYGRDAAAILDAAQECDPATWSRKQLAQSNHVTAVKHLPGSRERLQGVLAAHPDIQQHLCTLTAALGYGDDPRCGGAAAGPTQHASRRVLAARR